MQTRRDFIATAATAAGVLAVGSRRAWAAPKRILIRGGTGFVGPHQVRRAVERGHQVTIFNRGRSAPGRFGKDVEELAGAGAGHLDVPKGRKRDALIDESGSTADAPERVQQSACLPRHATNHYPVT